MLANIFPDCIIQDTWDAMDRAGFRSSKADYKLSGREVDYEERHEG